MLCTLCRQADAQQAYNILPMRQLGLIAARTHCISMSSYVFTLPITRICQQMLACAFIWDIRENIVACVTICSMCWHTQGYDITC